MRRLSSDLRKQVFERDGYKCKYCGFTGEENQLHIDHIVAKSRGGSDDINNLVTACAKCNVAKADKHLVEIITSTSDHYLQFKASMETIRSLLSVPIEEPYLREALKKLLYANVISAMETYLSDVLISQVLNSDHFLRKFVESNREYQKEKFSYCDIFTKKETIRDKVGADLLKQIYHRLDKVKGLYEPVFEIEFPSEIADLFQAIEIRHDIVHRDGKTKEGMKISFTDESVLNVLNLVEEFIRDLNSRLNL